MVTSEVLPTLLMAACIVCATAYMVRDVEIHRRVSITGTLFVTLLVMHGVTAVPYSLGLVGRDLVNGLPLSQDYPWFIGASFLFYVIGVWLAGRLLHFRLTVEQRRLLEQSIVRGPVNQWLLLALVLVAVAIALLYAFAGTETGVGALLRQARDESALREFRANFATGNPYAYAAAVVIGVVGPLLLLLLLNRAASSAPTMGKVALFGVCFVLFLVLALSSVANLQKAPLAMLVIFVLIDLGVVRVSGTRLTLRLWLAPVAVIGAVGLLGFLLTAPVTIPEAALGVVKRVFLAPQNVVDSYLFVYPNQVDFNHGLGIGLSQRIFGDGDYRNPPLLVGSIVTGSDYGDVGFNGFWSTELWASFGYPGVVIGSTLVGALMVGLDWWCLRWRRKTELVVALYAFLMVDVIRAGSVSIFTMLLSGGLILAPLLALLLSREVQTFYRTFARHPNSSSRPS